MRTWSTGIAGVRPRPSARCSSCSSVSSSTTSEMSPRTKRAPYAISTPPISVAGSTTIVSAVRSPYRVAQQAGEHGAEEGAEQEDVDAEQGDAPRAQAVRDDRRHDRRQDGERGTRERQRDRPGARRTSRSRACTCPITWNTPKAPMSPPMSTIAFGGLCRNSASDRRPASATADERRQDRHRDEEAALERGQAEVVRRKRLMNSVRAEQGEPERGDADEEEVEASGSCGSRSNATDSEIGSSAVSSCSSAPSTARIS